MINILGKKRVFFLSLFLLINAVLGLLIFFYLLPEKQDSETKLRAVSAQFSTVQQDLANIKLDLEKLQQQQGFFEELNRRGFFNFQGRQEARDVLQGLDDQAEIIFSKVSIGAGEISEHVEAAKADYVVLESPVSISIEAVDDVDVFNYLHLLNNVFPGHISVDEFVIKRELDVSGGVLRAIASGERPKMVDGRIQMMWRTMIPRSGVRDGGGQ